MQTYLNGLELSVAQIYGLHILLSNNVHLVSYYTEF